MMEPKDAEVSKFPIFDSNVSCDPFDFANIILNTSGYERKLTPLAVDRKGKPLPNNLRLMVESEAISQRLHLLFQLGIRHNTVTAIIYDVNTGSPTGIFHLLHDIKSPFYQNVEKKDMDPDTLKRCFMKSFERAKIWEEQFGSSRLDEDEREAYRQQYDLFEKEGYQPIDLADVTALMKEEMPGIKTKVEEEVRVLKDFNPGNKNSKGSNGNSNGDGHYKY